MSGAKALLDGLTQFLVERRMTLSPDPVDSLIIPIGEGQILRVPCELLRHEAENVGHV